jgi:hypothetical protein
MDKRTNSSNSGHKANLSPSKESVQFRVRPFLAQIEATRLEKFQGGHNMSQPIKALKALKAHKAHQGRLCSGQ